MPFVVRGGLYIESHRGVMSVVRGCRRLSSVVEFFFLEQTLAASTPDADGLPYIDQPRPA